MFKNIYFRFFKFIKFNFFNKIDYKKKQNIETKSNKSGSNFKIICPETNQKN